MIIPDELLPAIPAIIASTIAGAVAFLSSVFAKESKVSEFRQNWIDEVRNDIAELISAFYWITDSIERCNIKTVDDFLGESVNMKVEFLKIELAQAHIELRLNPIEHKIWIEKLHALVRFESFTAADTRKRDAAIHDFVSHSQKMLRKEWKKVKRGERIFQITKWVSLLVFIASLVFVVLIGSERLRIVWQP